MARAGRRSRTSNGVAARNASRWSLFRGGFLVGISNPKLLVFAAAFFPQFIATVAPWAPQFALLVATFLAVEACTYVNYAPRARADWRVISCRRRGSGELIA